VIGMGRDSTELGVEPTDFLPAYRLARSMGLRTTAHAGEDTGPDNIVAVVDALGVERVDHGCPCCRIRSSPNALRQTAFHWTSVPTATC
jgi:adenosine deaminase